MRVLLIKPPFAVRRELSLRHGSLVEPLGLECIAAALSEHEVRVLDMRLDGDLPGMVERFRPHACGISCAYTTETCRTLGISRAVKSLAPRSFVFVGGYHSSLKPDDFLIDSVDAVVVGEGETVACGLVECLECCGDPASVSGLVLNTEGCQVSTAPAALEGDIDYLPMPDRLSVERYRGSYHLGSFNSVAIVEASRVESNGSTRRMSDPRTVLRKSPERIVAEIREAKGAFALLADSDLLADPRRVLDLASLLRRSPGPTRILIQAQVDSVADHPELIEELAASRLAQVFLDIDRAVHREVGAGEEPDPLPSIERAFRVLRRSKIPFTAALTVDPADGSAEFRAVRRYIRAHALHDAVFRVRTPLPGTDLYREKEAQLTTRDPELFDELHAVLPTSMDKNQFYSAFAALWQCADRAGSAARRYWRVLSGISAGAISDTGRERLREGIKARSMLEDKNRYLDDHLYSELRRPELCPARGSAGRRRFLFAEK